MKATPPKNTRALSKRPSLHDESGVLTLDFLFAFTLVFGMTLVLFAVCLSLTVVELTQYVTYSVARNYYAAHDSRQLQTDVARTKFEQLTRDTAAFAPLFSSGWFQLSNLEVGPAAEAQSLADYPQQGDYVERSTFVGARVTLNAKVLEIRIPFFGDTYEQEDGFITRVSTFIGRAPSNEECLSLNANRWQAIRSLDSGYQLAPEGGYTVQADNGC